MLRYHCSGPRQINGVISISGAKNAALPMLAATLMADQPITLKKVPQLDDVRNMLKIMSAFGAKLAANDQDEMIIATPEITSDVVDHDLMSLIRASVLVIGPLLARHRSVKISTPGGCAIGERPIDMHLKALEQMGATITQKQGCIHLSAQDGLVGTDVVFDQVTVTGTENILMAATLARGTTQIFNAAREPEVVNLAELLIKMGAHIEGVGTDTIRIHGVASLHGAYHEVIPDRIEAGTYLIAAAMTQGHVVLEGVQPKHLTAVIEKLKKVGADITQTDNSITLLMKSRPKAVDIKTCAYPGFPTDLQAPWMAMSTVSEGMTTIHETIFEHRLSHAYELKKLGAVISVMGDHAVINGVSSLSGGAVLTATDLRAGAAMWLATLVSDGDNVIDYAYRITRGYEFFAEKVFALTQNVIQVDARVDKIID